MKEKIVVGLSGGVDSSVAAFLLKEQGYDVIGVTMQMWQPEDGSISCVGEAAVEDARRVSKHLDIPFYTLDFKKEFKRHVMDCFVEEYLNGRTPNPCVVCNRYVKWEALISRAKEFGADYIATGHYARIDRLPNGRYAVKNSVTATKDQTYALYNLTQEQLAHTMMPVGEYNKDEIREIAVKNNIPVANKPDSQEICFIPDNDYAGYIERACGGKVPGEGNYVSTDGKVLGRHKGIIHYTVGQRKGLNLAMGHPVFVTEIRPETDEVVIGENEEVFSTELYCKNVNYMAVEEFSEPRRFLGKIRYSHKGSYCMVYPMENGMLRCVFEEPVRAVTPGQAVVLYEDGCVALGGTICKK